MLPSANTMLQTGLERLSKSRGGGGGWGGGGAGAASNARRTGLERTPMLVKGSSLPGFCFSLFLSFHLFLSFFLFVMLALLAFFRCLETSVAAACPMWALDTCRLLNP